MSPATFASRSVAPQPSEPPMARTPSVAPTVSTFFAVPGEIGGGGAGAGVAGGEDDDHLLIAGRGHGSARRLGIAHERIVGLGVDGVEAVDLRSPAVRADAGAVAVGARLEISEVREGVGAGVEDDRGAELDEGCDAEAVVEAGGVLVGETRLVGEAAHDVGVESAVAIAALKRAPRMGRSLEPVVHHSARAARLVSVRVESEVVGRRSGVVEPAVAHVHRETGGRELRLREAPRGEEGEIAGSRGRAARQVAGHDLPLRLVVLARNRVGLNRDDIGPRGQGLHAGGVEGRDHVLEVEHLEAVANLARRVFHHTQRGVVGFRIVDELNGVERRLAGCARQGPARIGSGQGMEPVLVAERALPLNVAGRAGQGSDAPQGLVVPVDEVGVVRDIAHDPRARLLEGRVPRGTHGADELDEVQAPLAPGRGRGAQGLGFVRRGVDRACVQQDLVVLVAGLDALLPKERGRGRGLHGEQLIAAVVGEKLAALLLDAPSERGIVDADLAPRAPRARARPRLDLIGANGLHGHA